MNKNPFKNKPFLSFYLTTVDNIYLFFNIVEDFTADNSYLLFNIVEDFAFLGSCWTRQASLEKHWMLIWMLLGPVKLDKPHRKALCDRKPRQAKYCETIGAEH